MKRPAGKLEKLCMVGVCCERIAITTQKDKRIQRELLEDPNVSLYFIYFCLI